MRDNSAVGWAVIDDEGLKVRTVSETRRAAIVNWLVTEAGLLVTQLHTDENIEAMWNAQRGDAITKKVHITAAST